MMQNTLKCINLFGGPGIGKSTIAHELFSEMKKLGHKVEFNQEYVKSLVYSADKFRTKDQLYLFAKQHHFQRVIEACGMDYIVTDSPFIMGLSYCQQDDHLPYNEFKELMLKVFHSYCNINIFLKRSDDIPYQTFGRYQTFDEALIKDVEIKDLLTQNHIPFVEVDANKAIPQILNLL